MKRLTIAQIRRMKCFRCRQAQGYAQWSICADGNRPRAICRACDVSLNALVLAWAGDPKAPAKIARYTRKVLGEAPDR